MARSTGRGSSFADAFRKAIRDAGGEPPRRSYTAQSPRARYNHLMRTRAGRDALEQAGLSAAQQTQRRWARGVQNPGKANAAVINAVYETLARGRIPDDVKNATMRITGRIGTGSDIRQRGTGGHAPLLVDLSDGDWDEVEDALFSDISDDAGLEDMISRDLIEPNIGGSDSWFFPGSSYKVELDY